MALIWISQYNLFKAPCFSSVRMEFTKMFDISAGDWGWRHAVLLLFIPGTLFLDENRHRPVSFLTRRRGKE